MSELADFIAKHTDGTLAPWQVELAERILAGEEIVMHSPRFPGKRRLGTMVAAMWETEGRAWDVVASDPDEERRMRREARELAARLGSLGTP